MRSECRAVCIVLCLSAPRWTYAQIPGTLASERLRLAEITADSALAGFPGSPQPATFPIRPRFPRGLIGTVGILSPQIAVTWNSAIPYSMNDGAMWAGRGKSVKVSAGARAEWQTRYGRLRLDVAPQLLYSQNLPFQTIHDSVPGRSAYANPFHGPSVDASLDLPLRFGDRHLLRIDGGRSAIRFDFTRLSLGATTAEEWWGPGIRNALILSNNAAGIPRFFARTSRPLRSRFGSVEAELISGTLTKSAFFSDQASDYRTVSGLRVEIHPAFDSTLTFGFARVVYAPIGPFASPFTLTLARSFDALFRWERIDAVGQRSDQIASLFARWVFPVVGLEVYGEWARMGIPASFTELLTAPGYTGGWTAGFQWAQRKRNHAYLRLQSELNYLEQSRVFPGRPTPDFYSGRASPQGYTQRGQIVGAAIGPGASSQWIALDWILPRWQAGTYVGRIRWENDAMYRQMVPTLFMHDVSVLGGLRGAWRGALTDVSVDLTYAYRYNYLFQNGFASPGRYPFRTVDVRNVTLSLAVTPR